MSPGCSASPVRCPQGAQLATLYDPPAPQGAPSVSPGCSPNPRGLLRMLRGRTSARSRGGDTVPAPDHHHHRRRSKKPPWENRLLLSSGLPGGQGVSERNRLSKRGSALPGKRVGRNALLQESGAGIPLAQCQGHGRSPAKLFPPPNLSPGHCPRHPPSSALDTRCSAPRRKRSRPSSSPRFPQGFCPHVLLREIRGSHLIAFPAHVVIGLAGGMGRGRKAKARSRRRFALLGCAGLEITAGSEPEGNGPRRTAPAPGSFAPQ